MDNPFEGDGWGGYAYGEYLDDPFSPLGPGDGDGSGTADNGEWTGADRLYRYGDGDYADFMGDGRGVP